MRNAVGCQHGIEEDRRLETGRAALRSASMWRMVSTWSFRKWPLQLASGASWFEKSVMNEWTFRVCDTGRQERDGSCTDTRNFSWEIKWPGLLFIKRRGTGGTGALGKRCLPWKPAWLWRDAFESGLSRFYGGLRAGLGFEFSANRP